MDLSSLSPGQRTRLCAALKLSAEAPDEEIEKALDEAEAPETPETPETPENPPAPETPETPEEQPETPETPEPDASGMVQVPAETWKQVQENAQAGAAQATAAEETRRDGVIAQATSDGKISPDRKASMVNLHATDPEGFYRLLEGPVAEGGLAAGIIPVRERGSSADPVAAGTMSPEAFNAQMGALFGPQFQPSNGGSN